MLALGLLEFAFEHLTPGLDSSLGGAEGAVALFGVLQDLREVPVSKDTAQPRQQKTGQQQPTAEPKSER
ncbi:hypothetical protein D3C85_1655650 [compost metagenome]